MQKGGFDLDRGQGKTFSGGEGERGVCSALVRALSEIRAPYGATTNENRPFRLVFKAFRPPLPFRVRQLPNLVEGYNLSLGGEKSGDWDGNRRDTPRL
jgi:hypothetical protein